MIVSATKISCFLNVIWSKELRHDHWDDLLAVEGGKAEVFQEEMKETCDNQSSVRCNAFPCDSETSVKPLETNFFAEFLHIRFGVIVSILVDLKTLSGGEGA